MKKFKIAVIQMRSRCCDVERNLLTAEEFIRAATSKGAKIICLPELFSSGYDLKWVRRFADYSSIKTIDKMRELAKKISIYIVGGIANKRNDILYNSSYIFAPDGKVAIYDKNYLFRPKPMEEHKFFQEGSTINVVNTPYGKIGCAICNDVRYPELFSRQSLSGVKIIFMGFAWGKVRQSHLEPLLRARALENQVYIAAANQWGSSSTVTFAGNSMIIDYDGNILASKKRGEGILMAEVDYKKMDQRRKELPTFKIMSEKSISCGPF